MALIKMTMYEEAESDCDRALKLEPINAKTYLRRGTSRAAQSRFAEAEKDFRRVLDIEPDNAQAKIELRNCRTMMKQLEEASAAGASLLPTPGVGNA